jgi:hypothetical protein
MNTMTKINFKNDGVIEISEELLRDEVIDYGVVKGYWKHDGHGHVEQLEPYFYLTSSSIVEVSTRVYGAISVTLNLFNVSANHGGPSFPQTGGSASLGPGQWRLYFLGSLPGNSGIEVSVQFPGRAVQGEELEPKAEIEEEKGTIFKARAEGSSRPQAIRIAYRRADEYAAGRPYRVVEERVYAEENHWVCILIV